MRRVTRSRGVIAAIAAGVLAVSSVHAAQPSPRATAVDERWRRLSPAERVGQLFVVPFDGATADQGTAVAALIADAHVGGVILDPARGNFTNTPDAPEQVARLANSLQARALDDAGLPLLIAIAPDVDGYPDTALHGGMTPIPSAMALGATWDPDHAARVGEIVGRELAACGVNLFLGPDLDVLGVPRPGTTGDLGVRSFGGSPQWVRLFGQRFVEGVHTGSANRIAVVPSAFPGVGAADRNPDREVAIVESSLDELAARDLVPFLGVLDPAGRRETTADALTTTHVRFRAIQQQSDRPFSLDGGGLRRLSSRLSMLEQWSEAGGVVVSPGLGLDAVRRYIDPDLGSFSERRVIGEAIAAGNDVLVLVRFGPAAQPEAGLENMRAGIAWLVERYEQDDTVREAVDRAARRVLALKYRLSGDAWPTAVAVDAEGVAARVGVGRETVAAVAREALTVLPPTGGTGATTLRTSPASGDRILFVVDVRETRDCATCAATRRPDPDRLVQAVVRDYGPDGTARVRSAEDVSAITFADLKGWLESRGLVSAEDTPVLVSALPPGRASEVDLMLRRADWIVFAARDLRPTEAPASDALRLFLSVAPPEMADARWVVVALGAPYYLDTTELSKLSACYALYAHGEAFLDVAVRALFGDEPATGASPVSVPGAGYDLALRLLPDPAQQVTLALVGEDADRAIAEGDHLTVLTSVVRDINGRPTPDGTHVTFQRYDRAENVYLPDVAAETLGGQATAAIRADREGEIVVTASFDNGLRSAPLTLSIRGRGINASDVLALPEALLPAGLTRSRVPVDWGIFMLSLTLILLVGVLCYGLDLPGATAHQRVRLFLNNLAWGLSGYLLVAAGGVHLGDMAGAVRLWPRTWNPAYQAAFFSVALALVPLAPLAARSLRAWRAARQA